MLIKLLVRAVVLVTNIDRLLRANGVEKSIVPYDVTSGPF